MRAGRVGRPHGLDGSFYVTEADVRVLSVGVEIPGLGTIVARKGTDARPILRLDTVADRTAAEALRGTDIVLPDRMRPPLEEDEYLAEDLVGCDVVDGERRLGTVRRLIALPSCEALELDDGSLVPMVRDAITRVDVGSRTIHVSSEFLDRAT